MASHLSNPIPLDRVFTHSTESHSYEIHWTKLSSSSPDEATSKRSLILVHGTPWSSIVYTSLARTLSSRYNIYLFDHAGFGSSPARKALNPSGAAEDDLFNEKEGRYDSDHAGQAAVFAALYTSWGFRVRDSDSESETTDQTQKQDRKQDIKPSKEAPHILAHDNGCLTALRSILLHNLQPRTLALANGVILPPFDTAFFQTVASNRSAFLTLPASIHAGIVRGYIRSAMYTDMDRQTEDILAEPWLDGGRQGRDALWYQILQASRRNVDAVRGLYARVGREVAVCLLAGVEDVWIPSRRVEGVKLVLGAERVVGIERAGHLCMLDQEEEFAERVSGWLISHNVKD